MRSISLQTSLLLLIGTLVSGCLAFYDEEDPPPPLTFRTMGAGVPGVPYRVAVYDGSSSFGGCPVGPRAPWPPHVGCASVSGEAVTELIELTCDGCEVERAVVGDRHVDATLMRDEAGVATLSARVRLEGGDERVHETELEFFEPTEIHVECGEYPIWSCPGSFGVFPGAEWRFNPSVRGGAGGRQHLAMLAEVSVEGDAVTIDAGEDPRVRKLWAMHPGTARVRFSAGDVERVVEVRVASGAEVVSLSLERTGSPSYGRRAEPDGPILDHTEPMPDALQQRESLSFFLASTLSDGTRALGGPATMRSSDPDVLTVGYDDSQTRGWWWGSVGPRGIGAATIEVSLGSASVSHDLEVRPDPALVGMDAGF
jgi:hypothetical protein